MLYLKTPLWKHGPVTKLKPETVLFLSQSLADRVLLLCALDTQGEWGGPRDLAWLSPTERLRRETWSEYRLFVFPLLNVGVSCQSFVLLSLGGG